MTTEEREQIISMKENGYSYAEIAERFSMPVGSVRMFFSRRAKNGDPTYCLYCGKKLKQTKGHRQKKFCDEVCRWEWRKRNPDKRNLKAMYQKVCKRCGKEFVSYGNKKRVYCSWDCYMEARKENSIKNLKKY